MSKKVISTIYLDKEVLKKARELGLNISKTTENALKQAIYRLENLNPSNDFENHSKKEGAKRID